MTRATRRKYWFLYLAWAMLWVTLGWTFRQDRLTVERLRHQEVEQVAGDYLRSLDPRFSRHVVINSAFTDTKSVNGESRWIILLNRPSTHDFDEAVVLEMSPDGRTVLSMRKPGMWAEGGS